MFREAGRRVFGKESYQEMSEKHSPCRTGLEPTFWEFVQFVLKHQLSDDHWRPFSQACNVCSMQYRFIIKFERLQEEERELMEILGMKEKFPPMFLKMNSGRENATEKYLKMIRKEDCMGLRKMYKKDIETFGYREDVEKFIFNTYG